MSRLNRLRELIETIKNEQSSQIGGSSSNSKKKKKKFGDISKSRINLKDTISSNAPSRMKDNTLKRRNERKKSHNRIKQLQLNKKRRLNAEQEAAAKLKTEQEAAAKLKAEQEAAELKAKQEAATKLKAEQEAAAKLKTKQEAAAKLKTKQEAAAKLKAEQEAAAKLKAEQEAATKLKTDQQEDELEAAAKLKTDQQEAELEEISKIKYNELKLKDKDVTVNKETGKTWTETLNLANKQIINAEKYAQTTCNTMNLSELPKGFESWRQLLIKLNEDKKWCEDNYITRPYNPETNWIDERKNEESAKSSCENNTDVIKCEKVNNKKWSEIWTTTSNTIKREDEKAQSECEKIGVSTKIVDNNWRYTLEKNQEAITWFQNRKIQWKDEISKRESVNTPYELYEIFKNLDITGCFNPTESHHEKENNYGTKKDIKIYPQYEYINNMLPLEHLRNTYTLENYLFNLSDQDSWDKIIMGNNELDLIKHGAELISYNEALKKKRELEIKIAQIREKHKIITEPHGGIKSDSLPLEIRNAKSKLLADLDRMLREQKEVAKIITTGIQKYTPKLNLTKKINDLDSYVLWNKFITSKKWLISVLGKNFFNIKKFTIEEISTLNAVNLEPKAEEELNQIINSYSKEILVAKTRLEPINLDEKYVYYLNSNIIRENTIHIQNKHNLLIGDYIKLIPYKKTDLIQKYPSLGKNELIENSLFERILQNTTEIARLQDTEFWISYKKNFSFDASELTKLELQELFTYKIIDISNDKILLDKRVIFSDSVGDIFCIGRFEKLNVLDKNNTQCLRINCKCPINQDMVKHTRNMTCAGATDDGKYCCLLEFFPTQIATITENGNNINSLELGFVIQCQDNKHKIGIITKIIGDGKYKISYNTGSEFLESGDRLLLSNAVGKYLINIDTPCQPSKQRKMYQWEKKLRIKDKIFNHSKAIAKRLEEAKNMLNNINSFSTYLDNVGVLYINPKTIIESFKIRTYLKKKIAKDTMNFDDHNSIIRMLIKTKMSYPNFPEINNLPLDPIIYLRLSVRPSLKNNGSWDLFAQIYDKGSFIFKSLGDFTSKVFDSIRGRRDVNLSNLLKNEENEDEIAYNKLKDKDLIVTQLIKYADKIMTRDQRGYLTLIDSNPNGTPFYALSNMDIETRYTSLFKNDYSYSSKRSRNVALKKLDNLKECLSARVLADENSENVKDCGLGFDIVSNILKMINEKDLDSEMYLLNKKFTKISELYNNRIQKDVLKEIFNGDTVNYIESEGVESKVATIININYLDKQASIQIDDDSDPIDVDISKIKKILEIKETDKDKIDKLQAEYYATEAVQEKNRIIEEIKTLSQIKDSDLVDENVDTLTRDIKKKYYNDDLNSDSFSNIDYLNEIYDTAEHISLIDTIKILDEWSFKKGNYSKAIINEENDCKNLKQHFENIDSNTKTYIEANSYWNPLMIPIYAPNVLEKEPDIIEEKQKNISKVNCLENNILCSFEELNNNDPDSRYITFDFKKSYFVDVVNPDNDDAVKNTSSKKVVQILEKYKRGEMLSKEEKKLE